MLRRSPVLCVLLACAAACAPDDGSGRASRDGMQTSTYDFIALVDAARWTSDAAAYRGPRRGLVRAQPWSTDERLSLGVRPGAALVFDDVPLHAGGELSVACGLLSPPGPAGEGAWAGRGAAEPGPSARFLVDLEWGGRNARLLDHTVDRVTTDTHGWPDQRVALPASARGRGRVSFRVLCAGDPDPVQATWCGPRLTWPGAPIRGSVPFRRVRGALLDEPWTATPHAGSARRVSLDGAAGRFLPDGAGPFLRQSAPATASWQADLAAGSLLSFSVGCIAPHGTPARRYAFELGVDGRTLFAEEVVLGVPPSARRHVVDLVGGGGAPAGPRRLDLSVHMLEGTPGDEEEVATLWLRPMLERRGHVPRQRAGSGPNVLLVVVDTLRADHVSSHGYERRTTPHLDARAEDGVVFEQAVSQSSWTVPAVATLLTGHYAYTHGLYDAAHWQLLPSVPTLADAFAGAGISTVAVVANPLLTAPNDALRGFEDVLAVPHARAAQVNRCLLDWLDAHADERFFAYLHYQEPHDPYAAPGDELTAFGREHPASVHGPTVWEDVFLGVRDGLERASREGGTLPPEQRAGMQELIDLYDGEILSWDRRFEALLEELDARGLLQETLVVVTSDHGEEFGEHGQLGHGHSLYDELLRVPLVMLNTPMPAGRRHDLVGLIDLAPTLVRLAGLPDPATAGFAFVGEDLSAGALVRAHLFAQTSSHGRHDAPEPQLTQRALIGRDVKAISIADRDELLLFDRLDDPGERAPLDGEGASELAARCRQLLDDWERRCREHGAATDGLLDPDAIEALREMGYVR